MPQTAGMNNRSNPRPQGARRPSEGLRPQGARRPSEGLSQGARRLSEGRLSQGARRPSEGLRPQGARLLTGALLLSFLQAPILTAPASAFKATDIQRAEIHSSSGLTSISDIVASTPSENAGGMAEKVNVNSALVPRRLRIGLALGGGGTRGAAHVGVLKVLEREGIPIDCIAGTSMGSVVGGLYSAGVPVDEIEKKFTSGSLMKAFMTVPISVRLAATPLFLFGRLVGPHPYDGLYKGNKFKTYLNRQVPTEMEKHIETLHKPFCAVALNLVDGKEYALKNGDLGKALQASCAVPILRRPVQIEDKLFVDGGVVANLPVKHARDLGADIVIAVDVDERFQEESIDSFKRMGSVAHRVITLHLAKVDEPQLEEANVVIHPQVNGISLVSTKTRDAKAAIKAGERAATEALPHIRQILSKLAMTQEIEHEAAFNK